ncbi:1-phosphofructokinase [Caldibacillus lycopersici]|uniref:Tagatose-6-phosphate kinase n=1 Tax=Perspicuibacillus lycopersici TaxID=1325689 RepID=A0AAE3IR70_9BACI|nr:1-phosphofructokinase [Perspicuibacillus lycopersici]MCU9612937.1 1-phosphofructokinase [Perspicuibacillus lycopersici]
MIYTVTLNPSVDYIVEVEDVQLGGLNRTTNDMTFPGGKGINVSRVLNRYDIPTTALGFVGGFTGSYIKNILNDEGVQTDFVETNGNTRINVKLKSTDETEINGRGPVISQSQLQLFLQKINGLEKGDILVIAGSIPSTLPTTIYEEIAELAQRKELRLVADVSGAALPLMIGYRPFFMKPNHHEIGELYGVEINTVEEAATYGKKLIDDGVENVVVSMAGNGAVYLSKDKVLIATVPKGTVKNSVGAGDSLVAGFLAQYSKTNNFEEAFRYGVATGSATAFSDDLCQIPDVEALLPQVIVTEWK